MADHYYSIVAPAQSRSRTRGLIVVGTSATTSNPIELRVTDGDMSARDVYDFLEFLADLFVKRDSQVIPGGTIL